MVAGVRRTFGTTVALDGVDLELRGGVTGLVGPNGAGKTTLIGLLLGLDRPDAGTIRVLGMDPTTAGPEVRARIGYAPEHDPLPPDSKAQDVVRLIAELHGLDARTALERSADVLSRLGLGEERLREVGTMSTGQKQRVKLAQAIVHDPAVVFLDEPTDGLDPVQRADMLDLIGTLARELDLDVLVSSHLLPDLERICDRVVALDAGRVIGERDLTTTTEDHVVVVDTVRDAAAAGAELRAAGYAVEILTPTRLVVADAGDDVLDRLLGVLADTGVGIRSLGPRHRDLIDDLLPGAQP